jgi:hypothetical protein
MEHQFRKHKEKLMERHRHPARHQETAAGPTEENISQ